MTRQTGNLSRTFNDAGKHFVADTCQPLVAAAQAGSVQLCAAGRGGYPGRRLPPEELEGLHSISFWNAGNNQDWGLPPHRNEGVEISYLASGQTHITIEGHERTLLQCADDYASMAGAPDWQSQHWRV